MGAIVNMVAVCPSEFQTFHFVQPHSFSLVRRPVVRIEILRYLYVIWQPCIILTMLLRHHCLVHHQKEGKVYIRKEEKTYGPLSFFFELMKELTFYNFVRKQLPMINKPAN
jgi:hypothetical protein